MFTTVLYNKLKTLVLIFLNLFRRVLCCLRRRRRSSCDVAPLTHVISNTETGQREKLANWNDWGDDNKPKTVQDHIEIYRKQAFINSAEEISPEENVNFFEDMAPKITRQTKVLINTSNGENNISHNRLSFTGDSINIMPTSELADWEENSGWEGEKLDWDTQEALREKRRQEREKRLWEQQQKRQEKISRSLGARVNS